LFYRKNTAFFSLAQGDIAVRNIAARNSTTKETETFYNNSMCLCVLIYLKDFQRLIIWQPRNRKQRKELRTIRKRTAIYKSQLRKIRNRKTKQKNKIRKENKKRRLK